MSITNNESFVDIMKKTSTQSSFILVSRGQDKLGFDMVFHYLKEFASMATENGYNLVIQCEDGGKEVVRLTQKNEFFNIINTIKETEVLLEKKKAAWLLAEKEKEDAKMKKINEFINKKFARFTENITELQSGPIKEAMMRRFLLEQLKEERKRQELEMKRERERLEKERLEQERQEKERLKQERQEKERLEKERLERRRLEEERIERGRTEREKEEMERLEQEKLEQDRLREKIEKALQAAAIEAAAASETTPDEPPTISEPPTTSLTTTSTSTVPPAVTIPTSTGVTTTTSTLQDPTSQDPPNSSTSNPTMTSTVTSELSDPTASSIAPDPKVVDIPIPTSGTTANHQGLIPVVSEIPLPSTVSVTETTATCLSTTSSPAVSESPSQVEPAARIPISYAGLEASRQPCPCPHEKRQQTLKRKVLELLLNEPPMRIPPIDKDKKKKKLELPALPRREPAPAVLPAAPSVPAPAAIPVLSAPRAPAPAASVPTVLPVSAATLPARAPTAPPATPPTKTWVLDDDDIEILCNTSDLEREAMKRQMRNKYNMINTVGTIHFLEWPGKTQTWHCMAVMNNKFVEWGFSNFKLASLKNLYARLKNIKKWPANCKFATEMTVSHDMADLLIKWTDKQVYIETGQVIVHMDTTFRNIHHDIFSLFLNCFLSIHNFVADLPEKEPEN